MQPMYPRRVGSDFCCLQWKATESWRRIRCGGKSAERRESYEQRKQEDTVRLAECGTEQNKLKSGMKEGAREKSTVDRG